MQHFKIIDFSFNMIDLNSFSLAILDREMKIWLISLFMTINLKTSGKTLICLVSTEENTQLWNLLGVSVLTDQIAYIISAYDIYDACFIHIYNITYTYTYDKTSLLCH